MCPLRTLPLLGLLLGLAAAAPAPAATYLTQDQALAVAFEEPASARRHPLVFDGAARRAIEKATGDRVGQRGVLAFSGELKGGGPGVALLDAVVGKHEDIDYMVVLDRNARIRLVEILAYRESYGGEVRGEAWRRQFRELSPSAPPSHNGNVIGISGATLSCRHVTGGVRKLLAVAAFYAKELGLEPHP